MSGYSEENFVKWFLAENVGGLRNANEGKAFSKILSELRDAGYTITPHLYKFEEYGIPQARHRIIIVGNGFDLAHNLPTSYNDFLDFLFVYLFFHENYLASKKYSFTGVRVDNRFVNTDVCI